MDAVTQVVQALADLGTIAILLFLLLQSIYARDKEREQWQIRLDSKERAHVEDLKDCAGLTPHIVARTETRRPPVVPAHEADAYQKWLNGGEG